MGVKNFEIWLDVVPIATNNAYNPIEIPFETIHDSKGETTAKASEGKIIEFDFLYGRVYGDATTFWKGHVGC